MATDLSAATVRSVNIVARCLPLVTVLAWAITIAVPVLDSAEPSGPNIVVNSFGAEPYQWDEVQDSFLIAWIAVLVCAAWAWWARPQRVWSVVTLVVAGGLAWMLLGLLLRPPMLMWDGVDAQGRPTGGSVVGEPAAGAVLWAIGIIALGVSGLWGFLSADRQSPSRVEARGGTAD